MKIGANVHKGMAPHFRKKGIIGRVIPKHLLAIAATSYYINDDDLETRIYLHNYFALTADSPEARAKWSVEAYSRTGKKVARQEGYFTGPEGMVIEISKMAGVDIFGVLQVKLELQDQVYFIDQSYHAIYYIEYTRKNGPRPQKVIYHSLGSPSAGVFSYARENYTDGSFFPAGARPYFLYANGSLLKLHNDATRASGFLQIINHRGEALDIPLPEIPESLGCQRIDVLSITPELRGHVDGKPFSLKIRGNNILSKSFWYLMSPDTFVGEHF